MGTQRGTGERRREPRWPCGLDVAIMPMSAEGGFVEARVVDFSAHGLGLAVAERLRVGEQLVVKDAGERTALLIYAVRNCEPDGAGFRAGTEFTGAITSPDNEDEQALWRAFVARLEAAAAHGAQSMRATIPSATRD